jgi:uncharacterized repeat protein (TIGR02059 family)
MVGTQQLGQLQLGTSGEGGGSDTTPPVVVSRSIDGSLLIVTYDEPLDPAFVPSSNAFVCKVGGVERAVTGVSLSGSDVQLTLASPVVGNDMVTLSYTS